MRIPSRCGHRRISSSEEGDEEPPPPWEPEWIDIRSEDIANTSIVEPGYIGGALQIEVPEGTLRAVGARYYFPGEHRDEIWFRYMLRLTPIIHGFLVVEGLGSAKTPS